MFFLTHLLTLFRTTLEIFDSLGVDNTKLDTLKKYLKFKGIKNIHINETAVQQENSDSCGLFVVYYIWQRMYNLDLSFDEILEQSFTIEKESNEENVKQFCEQIEKESD